MKIRKNFSEKIITLSFLMSVFVIFIHADNLKYYGLETLNDTVVYHEVHLFADTIGSLAVPYFFTISGFWFFHLNIYDQNVWKQIKIRNIKKLNSLVIPYLLWNTFGMIFYMTITRIPMLSNLMNNGEKISINFSNIFAGIFMHKFYFPFWYMKDLIIISFLLGPILAFFLRKKILSILFLIMMVILSLFRINLVFVKPTSILYFSLGAVLAIYYRSWFEHLENIYISIIYIVLLLICIIILYFEVPVASEICLYISPIFLCKAGDIIPRIGGWFPTQSFFIYAFHIIPVTVIGHLLKMVGDGITWAAYSYIIAVILTVGLTYLVAQILFKICPKLYFIICGGR